MGGGPKGRQPAQCVAEAVGQPGVVLAGTVRSISLVLEDAVRHGECAIFVRLASGEGGLLPMLSASGERVVWRLRPVLW